MRHLYSITALVVLACLALLLWPKKARSADYDAQAKIALADAMRQQTQPTPVPAEEKDGWKNLFSATMKDDTHRWYTERFNSKDMEFRIVSNPALELNANRASDAKSTTWFFDVANRHGRPVEFTLQYRPTTSKKMDTVKHDTKGKGDGELAVVPFLTDYMEAAGVAVKEGKPLCIWVAYKCPSSANQLPDLVHVFLDKFDGSDQQRVVCATPDGKGWLNLSGVVKASDCCATNIEKALNKPTQTQTIHTTTPHMNTNMMQSQPVRFRGGAGGACAT